LLAFLAIALTVAYSSAPAQDKKDPKKKTDPAFEAVKDDPKLPRVLLIGDSISTGFGDEGTDPCPYTIDTENHFVTWEAVAARAVGAELVTTAWQGKGLVCNVGDGPCTMPFPTYYDRTLPARADSHWDFSSWQPHAVVINLGTNDFSSSVDPTPAEFATGYVNFLRHIRSNYPGALILLTCGPMLGTSLGIGGFWNLPITCHWLAVSRAALGPDKALIGINGAQSGLDIARMMLAGASAVAMASPVMLRGFELLESSLREFSDYLAAKNLRAADLIGRAADQRKGFADMALRTDNWRNYVPKT